MKQLRAFLYSRSVAGEWASTPYREFEPFFEAVTTAIKDGSSAAIHIGFWRPDTATVASLASQRPGALLITDAAAGALPPPVVVSVMILWAKLTALHSGLSYQALDVRSKIRPKRRPLMQLPR